MKDFLNYMDKCLKSLFKENKEIYIAGDFNTDFLKIESNQSYLEFYNLITSSGFLPHIIQPTIVTEYSSTVIDNIFANTFRSGTIIGNLLLSISEHHCLFVSIENNNVSLKKLNIYQRNYSKYNIRAFRNDISLVNWKNDSPHVNDLYNDFITCVNQHALMKKLAKKEVKLKSKPWMTLHTTNIIDLRNKLCYRKKGQPDNENIKNFTISLEIELTGKSKSQEGIFQYFFRREQEQHKKELVWY